MSDIGVSPVVQKSFAPDSAYLWSFPGAPIRVWIDLATIESISAKLPSDSGSASGVLFGHVDGSNVRVTSIEPVAAVTAAKLEAVARRSRPGQIVPVGFYVADSRSALRLDANEVRIVKQLFAEPYSVVLLIQTGRGTPNASFMFWDNGQFVGDFAFLEFPFVASELARQATQKRAALEPRREQPKEVAEPAARPQSLRKSRKPLWIGAVAVLLAGVAIAVFWSMRQGYIPELRANRAPTPEKNETNPSPAPEPSSLGLNAEKAGAGVKITWTRNAPAVLEAASGTLSIRDGASERTLDLSREHLRTGSVVLQPQSERVEIKLALATSDGMKSETVFLLLGTTNSAAVQVVRPPREQRRPNPTGTNSVAQMPAPKAEARSDTARSDTAQPAAPAATPERRAETAPQPGSGRTGTSPTVSETKPPEPSRPPATETAKTTEPPKATAPAKLTETAKAEQPPRIEPDAERSAPPRVAAAPIHPRIPIPPAPIYQQRIAMTPLLRSMLVRDITVSVRVTVDETGRVTKARATPTPSVNPFVGSAAETAARQWRYRPATIDGHPVASESVIEFQFRP